MVRVPSGVRSVNRCLARPLRQLATVGAFALALSLTACGLKGSLDPPPAQTPAQAQVAADPQQQPPPESDQPPQPVRKRIFLDWLLD
jgi:predicted small lipoprotein YifL